MLNKTLLHVQNWKYNSHKFHTCKLLSLFQNLLLTALSFVSIIFLLKTIAHISILIRTKQQLLFLAYFYFCIHNICLEFFDKIELDCTALQCSHTDYIQKSLLLYHASNTRNKKNLGWPKKRSNIEYYLRQILSSDPIFDDW